MLISLKPVPDFDEKETFTKMMDDLGNGPMRFGAARRPLDVKRRLLQNSSDLEAFIRLEVETEKHGLQKKFTIEQIFRVALYHNFDVEKSVRLLKHMDERYWNVSADQLAAQLETKTLFPLPSTLMSKDKKIKSFFYMKPSRFVPDDTKTSGIIANLLYVLDSLDQYTEPHGRNKIGFIANMNDWTMENFTVDYCLQFMDSLQGKKGPVTVDLFLIVNPPSWFDKVWQIMKPMLSTTFRRKVHMIPETKLSDYLASGYEKYLPSELNNGRLDVPDLVRDFIQFRRYIETKVYPDERRPNKETRRLVRLKTDTGTVRRYSVSSKPSDRMAKTVALRKSDRRKQLGRFGSSSDLSKSRQTSVCNNCI